jgi:lysozyme
MTVAAITLVLSILRQEEGLRLDEYRCTAGKLSCWYGRNLDDRPLDDRERAKRAELGNTKEFAEWLLERDVGRVVRQVEAALPWAEDLDATRQAVLLAMAYQMGVPGLLKFTNTLAAVRAGKYPAAAAGMLASRWAKQTPARARRMAEIMKNGRTT